MAIKSKPATSESRLRWQLLWGTPEEKHAAKRALESWNPDGEWETAAPPEGWDIDPTPPGGRRQD